MLLDTSRYVVTPGRKIDLGALATVPRLAHHKTSDLREMLREYVTRFAELQEALYAEDRQALLLVFQGMGCAGKAGTIRHVTTGVNPQGLRVTDYRQPRYEDMEYSCLYRLWKTLPERGHIGIFNRSHYEEVVAARADPELGLNRHRPAGRTGAAFWDERLRDIAAFERHLANNGTMIVKFFLHISKEEQKARLLSRLDNPAKQWQFDPSDLVARRRWKEYASAYESAFEATSIKQAPWYVIPGDNKHATHAIVASIIVETLAGMKPRYPEPGTTMLREIMAARRRLA